MSYPPINIPGLTLPDVPSVATNSAGPMLPEPVECGTPCGACEALAHDNARLRDEVAASKWNADDLCQQRNDFRAEAVRLAEQSERYRLAALKGDTEIARLREHLDRLARPFFHGEHATVQDENTRLRAEVARLQMQVDSMCDAEELRQEREARKQAEAEVARLTHDLSVATNWAEHHSQHASDLIGELARLREPNCTLVGFDATERTLTVQMDEPIMDRGWRLSQRATLAGEGGK